MPRDPATAAAETQKEAFYKFPCRLYSGSLTLILGIKWISDLNPNRFILGLLLIKKYFKRCFFSLSKKSPVKYIQGQGVHRQK